MIEEILSAATGVPLMLSRRSPARRPAAAAGELPTTWSTVVVAFPADVMKRIVKITIASTTFAAGPAAIAATRFQVAARQ